MADRPRDCLRPKSSLCSYASGSVQGETQSYSLGKNNVTEAPSAECIWNTAYTVWSVLHGVGHFEYKFNRERGITHQLLLSVGVRVAEWLPFRVLSK